MADLGALQGRSAAPPQASLQGRPDYVPYDPRKLSYANTFPNPWRAGTIRTMEWLTGKVTLLGRIRRFERMGVPEGQAFWSQALDVMGIRLETPAEEIARIPATGPLVVVANHPHGLVDGMVLTRRMRSRRTSTCGAGRWSISPPAARSWCSPRAPSPRPGLPSARRSRANGTRSPPR